MGMVSKKMGEEEIKTMFSQFGPIEDCTVLRDDNGVSRGGRDHSFRFYEASIEGWQGFHNHGEGPF